MGKIEITEIDGLKRQLEGDKVKTVKGYKQGDVNPTYGDINNHFAHDTTVINLGRVKAYATETEDEINSMINDSEDPDPDPEPIKVTGVSFITEGSEVEQGDVITLKSNVEPSDADNKNVSYSTDGDATIDGDVLTINDDAEGDVTVTATTEDGDFTDTITFTVKEPIVLVESFTIDPKTINLEVDESGTSNLTYIRPTNADDKTFKVTVEDSNIATVSINGTTLTINGLSEGTTSFTVESNDGGASNVGTINVIVPEPEDTEG